MRRIAERELFEHCTHGAALVTKDGLFQEVNPAFCHLTGYAKVELEAKRFQEITHPEDVDSDTAMAELVASGSANKYAMDKRYLTKDGRVIWVELTVVGVRDSANRFLCFLAQARLKPPHRPATVSSPDLPPDVALALWVRRHWPKLTAAAAVAIGGAAKAAQLWLSQAQ